MDAGVPGRSSWVHPFEPSSGSQAAVSPGISMFPGSAKGTTLAVSPGSAIRTKGETRREHRTRTTQETRRIGPVLCLDKSYMGLRRKI
ncbi:MAG: hypothetical protein GDA43_26515 [Hormoscilla sp. SP5CHS1]|nr:hypothetical protein [Hormoscilla sp. SP5CHS1]